MDALDLSLMTASLVTFFVVIDPIGVAPIFASLTEGSTHFASSNVRHKFVPVSA